MAAGDEHAVTGEAQRLHDAAAALRHRGDATGAQRTFAELAERFGHAEDPDDAFQAAIAEIELADFDTAVRDDVGAAAHANAAWTIGGRLTAAGLPSGAFLSLQAGSRLARCHLASGDGDQALRALRQTLQALGARPEDLTEPLIPSARRVAFVLVDNQGLASVGPLLEELVRFAGRQPPPAVSDAQRVRGDALARAGRERAALAAYRAALAARPGGSPVDDLARAELLTSVGLTADHLGQYASAAQAYELALEIREHLLPLNDPERVLARYNVAELARYTGADLDHAADELEAVAKLLRGTPPADPDLLSLALKNSAQARIAQKRPKDAEALIREALAVDAGGVRRRAQLLVTLAQTQREQGRQPDVVPELERLGQDMLATEGPESRTYLWLLGSVAPLLPDARKDSAQRSYEQILESIGEPQDAGERDLVIGALINLASSLWSSGDHAGALDAFRRASQQQEQVRAERWRIRSALATEGGDPLPLAGAVVELVLRNLVDDDDARCVAFRIGTGSKRLQAEVLRRQRELVLEGEDELLEVHALASRLRVAAAAGETTGDADEDELDDLDALLASSVPPRALLDAFDSSEARAVSDFLPRGSVLVEYLRCRGFKTYTGQTSRVERPADWYVAFVLPARAPQKLALIDLGDATPIDEAVLELRAAIASNVAPGHGSQDWRVPARAAAELVWDPVAPLVDVDATVIVASDGQLGALPFDVLVTANGQPLLTQLTLTSIGTGRDARLLDARPNWRSEPPVVIGAPEFGEPWAPFVPLPGTQGEANRIGTLLQVEPQIDVAATRELLLGVRDPEILHLATHGYYLPAAEPTGPLGTQLTALATRGPLVATGVALADANRRVAGATSGFAGVVSALDVLGLELYGTDLAVLSACESGLGPLDNGEGLVSLARSFLLAGARSVLWTLWRVDDWVTADLMTGFYQRLLRAAPRGAALYRAKRDVFARFPNRPDLWGGFVLQGDPAELARYRLLIPPSRQIVKGSVSTTGNVTSLDSGRRLFATFDVPVEDDVLRVASIDVRNLGIASVEDTQADAMRAFQEERYQDAVDGLTSALGRLDESSAAARQLAAKLHSRLAVALAYTGDLQRSREQGLAALAAYEALEDWPLELGRVLDNLAAAEVELGHPAEARAYYERALAVKRQERPGGHWSVDFSVARLAELDERQRPGGTGA